MFANKLEEQTLLDLISMNLNGKNPQFDRRINNVTEKPKHEKVNPSKFVKYKSTGYSSSDKDRPTGDVQWK